MRSFHNTSLTHLNLVQPDVGKEDKHGFIIVLLQGFEVHRGLGTCRRRSPEEIDVPKVASKNTEIFLNIKTLYENNLIYWQ